MANCISRKRARPRRAPRKFVVEGLEPRCLLAPTVVEYPLPSARIHATEIVSGPDGNLWFTELVGNKIGQINPTTHAVAEFPLPSPSKGPHGIILGPDGNLWFTEFRSGIGQINPITHAIAEFGNPTGTAATGITAGPDGNVWFTGMDEIGMINPTTHVVAVFPLPFRFSTPYGITLGPDGNLWYTEEDNAGTGLRNIIGMINPTTHAITEFRFPGAPDVLTGNYPFEITAGPDGNLWFTETSDTPRIGQINPTTHEITQIILPAHMSPAFGIATGADGNIWFTEREGSRVGQINPTTHVITLFPIPTAHSVPEGITAGPDGNLWFVEASASQIAEIQIAAPRIATTIQLISNANPAPLGQPVTFTAIVNPTGAGTPTGNITFSIDGVGQLAVPLSLVNNREQATFTASTLTASSHIITAAYSGDLKFTSGTSQLVNTVIEAPSMATALLLISTTNPSPLGQAVTYTAIVFSTGPGTPTGNITFSIDGVSQLAVPISVVNNQDQATFTTSTLTLGSHTITATYSGDRNFTRSTSQLAVTVFEDGPTITNLQRFGVHAQPSTLVLTFDKPLDPTRAQNVNNYLLVGPNHKRIRIRLAQYHPTALTVTLFPAQRLNLHRNYRLTVVGTGPTGLTDTHGNLLDGARTGQPGSNYVATIDIHTLTAAHVRTRRRQA